MTTTVSSNSAASTSAPHEFRRAHRDLDDSVLGGVAAGLAEHLRLPVFAVRVAFVITTMTGGLGAAFYGGLWLMLPARQLFEEAAPGIESASRGGRRPRRTRKLADTGPLMALAALGVGAIFAFEALIGQGAVIWPIVVGALGIALLWRQADEAQRERWLDSTGRVNPSRVILGDGGWANYARLAAGLSLVLVALLLFSLRGGSLSLARDVTLAALLGVGGIGLVVGPWVFRLASELTSERAERVRTQERADMAAHLHDSVLQTLALIQNNAGNSSQVARLARAQERDLRSWLYAGEAIGEQTVASALRAAAAEVEDAHGLTVDVVAVGDCDFVEALRPIVAATREAITNAAKHAQVGQVDVYAEIGDEAVEVFVRDRGAGFDPTAVEADRLGITNSIEGRMERHGGTSDIRSQPGEGTEVRLRLPLPEPGHRPEENHTT